MKTLGCERLLGCAFCGIGPMRNEYSPIIQLYMVCQPLKNLPQPQDLMAHEIRPVGSHGPVKDVVVETNQRDEPTEIVCV